MFSDGKEKATKNSDFSLWSCGQIVDGRRLYQFWSGDILLVVGLCDFFYFFYVLNSTIRKPLGTETMRFSAQRILPPDTYLPTWTVVSSSKTLLKKIRFSRQIVISRIHCQEITNFPMKSSLQLARSLFTSINNLISQ